MIKSKFIELIRLNIFGGSEAVDRLYLADPRRVELDITAALNTLFFQIFKKDRSNLDRYAKTYKNVAVLYDSSIQTYYSILPAKVIQFPTVGDGIWNISMMTGQDVTFVPVTISDKELLYNNEFNLLDDVIGYSLSGNLPTDTPPLYGRVSYYNHDPLIIAVRMELIVDFTEWDLDEDIPIPSGQDLEIVNIIRQMYQLKPADRLNNQNELA